MRVRLLLFVAALFSSALYADKVSPAKRALIDELLSLSRGSELAAESSMLLMATAQGQLPGTAAEIDQLRKQNSEEPEHRAEVLRTHNAIYERFTEAQLRELVTFLKSDVGKRFVQAQLDLAATPRQRYVRPIEAIPSKPDARQQTIESIRSVATAAEAYATDHNMYPKAADMAALGNELSPIYIRSLPAKDGWGRPLRYVHSADRTHYRFVSAGANGKIEPSSLAIGGRAGGDDIIFEDGVFVQAP